MRGWTCEPYSGLPACLPEAHRESQAGCLRYVKNRRNPDWIAAVVFTLFDHVD